MIDQRNLELLLQSHFPIVIVESHEEGRIIDMLQNCIAREGKRLMAWSATEGLTDHWLGNRNKMVANASMESWAVVGMSEPATNSTLEPGGMLENIKKQTTGSVIVLLDFHPYLTDPRIIRLIKEIAVDRPLTGNTFVLVSHEIEIPGELQKLCARFELSLPDSDTLRKMVLDEAKIWSRKYQKKVKADRKALELLVQNLRGLTVSDARRQIKNAIYNDGAITHSDVKEVMEAKYKLVDQQGTLSFEYDTANFSEVGGFERLKKWLKGRKRHFLNTNSKTRIDVPKGILLLGVQGCGKSLAAKCVAGVWGIPLLRLDFGALFNKYIGETEKNIRDTLKSAEILSPCVLWIDEIEKGIESGGDDGGTTRRVLGTLLTWMAEKTAQVFLVATANDITCLPPELIRKGRMDEIFFVDLPTAKTRMDILSVHLRKRKLRPGNFDLRRIARESKGFSGAELEQAVVSACYSASSLKQKLGSKHILEELKQTRPLSVVMAESINQLREWAKRRTVSANE